MTQVGKPLVEVRHLVKHFPITGGATGLRQVGAVAAVDDVTFDVLGGETLGIVGETGCGKTTMARLLTRLLEPTSGEVRFDGEDITKRRGAALKGLRREIQMIFGDPDSSLNPRKTVAQIIAAPSAIHGLEPGEIARNHRVRQLLTLVGLEADCEHRYPSELSAGERQRVGIARALALEPKLLVADEPVSALDLSIRPQILSLLGRLQADLGLTVVFLTRDVSVARQFCDRVAVLYSGKIVELASNEALYAFPRHPYTGALLAAVPVPRPARSDRGRALLTGDAPGAGSLPSGCRFHPRCPNAQHLCTEHEPPLVDKGRGTVAACHYPLAGQDPNHPSPALSAAADTNR